MRHCLRYLRMSVCLSTCSGKRWLVSLTCPCWLDAVVRRTWKRLWGRWRGLDDEGVSTRDHAISEQWDDDEQAGSDQRDRTTAACLPPRSTVPRHDRPPRRRRRRDGRISSRRTPRPPSHCETTPRSDHKIRPKKTHHGPRLCSCAERLSPW